MSYCVNCGVELADSETRCPLCGVEVVTPVKPWVEPKTPPYPERLERIMSRIDRRFFAGLLGVILLIPVCITLLIDLLANNGVTWSAYVVGGITVFFFVVVFLFCLFTTWSSFVLVCSVVFISATSCKCKNCECC